jgi:hypothetical protein
MGAAFILHQDAGCKMQESIVFLEARFKGIIGHG